MKQSCVLPEGEDLNEWLAVNSKYLNENMFDIRAIFFIWLICILI